MRQVIAILLLFTVLISPPAAAPVSPTSSKESKSPSPLVWKETENKVSASVDDWKLDRLMKEIAKVSKWQVFVEPGSDITVSVKFQDQTVREALSRMLQGINYAVVREPDSTTKLLIFKTKAQNAIRAIKPITEEELAAEITRIGNELIVSVKPGTDINSIAARYGAKVVGAIPELGLYRLRFDDQEKADFAKTQLANFPEVKAVEYNYTIARPDSPVVAGTSSSLPFSLNPTAASGGNGLVIGLVDTAVQPLSGNMNDFLLKAIYAAGAPDLKAGLLHGTSMADTILRAMSAASEGGSSTTKILPVDVFGANANSSTFDLANGIYLAVKNGATIINMSLGSPTTAGYLETLIANSSAQGVLFLGAAGNEHTDSATYPAAYNQVIAVSAANRNGEIASYANYGEFVDVVAPGSSIVTYNGKNYVISGTSSATATASGVASILKSNKATADQIRQKLSQLWPKK
ncbi:MAG TPA: S8 family serine peptidase [Verrucomicrobiae bacterium]